MEDHMQEYNRRFDNGTSSIEEHMQKYLEWHICGYHAKPSRDIYMAEYE